MVTKTIKLYSINELSEEAQERALFDYTQDDIYFGSKENENSLKKFEEIFPIKVNNWEYGYRNNIDVDFKERDEIQTLSGLRLSKYLWNNYKNDIYSKKYYSTSGRYEEGKYIYKHRYSKFQIEEGNSPLTGYYMDNEILNDIWEYIDRPDNRNFEELLSDCLYNWIKACNADYEYQSSMEAFIENSEANEWTY